MARARILMQHPETGAIVETNVDAFLQVHQVKGWVPVELDADGNAIPVVLAAKSVIPEGDDLAVVEVSGTGSPGGSTDPAGDLPESGTGDGSDADPTEPTRSRRGS